MGDARDLPYGSASACVAVLTTGGRRVFAKAVPAAAPAAALLRNEARVTAALPAGIAPAPLGRVEAGGWLVLLAAYRDGRHPVVAPGSPDLAPLAATLAANARRLTGCAVPVLPLARRWAGYVDPELLAGDTVLHTDVTPRNFLTGGPGGRLLVVDWAAPARGPVWVGAALLLCRLVRAGHGPAAAVAWAGALPLWRAVEPAAAGAVLGGVGRLWARRQRAAPAAPRAELIGAARALSRYLAGVGRAGRGG
ncbi:hypothetical protein [Pilimelia anulata]|uniref:hypothetical protein n=1 Tax=Pilimelia anulata TaxID=53371 RepID=UPI001665EE4F|nr:hypothetical protein [Pilimelia anulata]